MTLHDELAGYCTPGANAGLAWLAPPVTARVALAMRTLGGGYRVVSTARSTAAQARLYERYRSHGGPPVAPPGTSKHNPGKPGSAALTTNAAGFVDLIPRDSWAVAVDAGPVIESAAGWRDIERVMVSWGMWLTVGVGSRRADGTVATRRKGHEPWHFEPMPDWQPDLLRGVLYYAERIRSLPGAPDSVDAAELVAWFRAFTQGRPFDTSALTQRDIEILSAAEAFLAGLNRDPLR